MSGTKRRFVFISFVIIFVIPVLNGCFYGYAYFSPEKDELPITFFNRYKVEITGYSAWAHNLRCNLSFYNSITDTSALDTIPIIVFDEICFVGNCLDSNFCIRPKSQNESDEEEERKGRLYWGTDLIRDKDLYYVNGKIKPGNYTIYDVYRIPERCDNKDIVVEIKARLIDRKSRTEIARENKIIQFEIKRGKRVGMS